MRRSPSIVPEAIDRDNYLVLDDFGRQGRSWRENDEEDANRKVVQERTRCSAYLFFRTVALCASIALLWLPAAMARGGGHGRGGFGFHVGGRLGHSERMMTPAYVLISVSAVSDADAFKKAIEGLTTSVAAFTGRLAVDAERPLAWEGAAPEHVVIIQFVKAEQAQAWKDGEAYKSFDADLRKSSASTVQLVQGLPLPEPRGGRFSFDAKAFEPNVQDYDRLLNQRLKAICKGC